MQSSTTTPRVHIDAQRDATPVAVGTSWRMRAKMLLWDSTLFPGRGGGSEIRSLWTP
ncbi:uncharacterized protein TrAtP1_011313 [Trichoderma atroviride]|uniref:uncharacterized protein n=1 Tax=Hypocrea atroviridis TaxID=63577 RepID=UPI003316B496|nr:hypothetical protein TrAtP1_011313 [Trichoderma atroviride]